MSLGTRVSISLMGLILLTVLGAWLIAMGIFLRPLLASLLLERADTALYVAGQVELAQDPEKRMEDLARELGVELQAMRVEDLRGFFEEKKLKSLGESRGSGWRIRGMGAGWGGQGMGWTGQGWRCRLSRRGRTLWVSRGVNTRVFVPDVEGGQGVLVSFPLHLSSPLRQVNTGFVVLGLLALLGAIGMLRWILKPLNLASSAMERVAAGDLQHRVPEGRDAAGRMGATFNRMAERVQALVQGQRRLMAAVSHELRTPLARMRISSEILRDEGAPGKRLDSLEADIQEMDVLVGEILESARLDQGVVALHRRESDLRGLVEDALEQSHLQQWDVELDIEEGLIAHLDPIRISRVLGNLLSNTRRYTPPGSTVFIRASRRGGGWLRLSVEDQGPGVPREDLEHIFEPFFRSDSSRSRKTGGLGLGLMLVSQVVKAHGGRVRAWNRRAGGLGIEILLPLGGQT